MHSKGQVISTPNTPLYINIRDRTKCSSNPIFPLSQRASSLPLFLRGLYQLRFRFARLTPASLSSSLLWGSPK